jgi:hypothetical protein
MPSLTYNHYTIYLYNRHSLRGCTVHCRDMDLQHYMIDNRPLLHLQVCHQDTTPQLYVIVALCIYIICIYLVLVTHSAHTCHMVFHRYVIYIFLHSDSLQCTHIGIDGRRQCHSAHMYCHIEHLLYIVD